MNGSQRSWMCSHLKVMLSFICSLTHTMMENGLNAKKGLLFGGPEAAECRSCRLFGGIP